jgi:hypothetical protein
MIRYLLISLLVLPLAGQSATYYVATNGNNSAAGSLAAPWATVAYASTIAQPGDTVLVQPGIYQQREVISGSGTTNSMITFRANGPVTNRGQWHITGSNLRIDGFEVTGGGAWLSGMDSHYMAPGVSNVWIVNNFFHDSPGGWDTAVSVDASGWANSIVVSNNTLHHWGAANDAAIVARGWNWLVVGNTISNTFGGDAFRVLGGNNTFRNNRVVEFGSYISRVYGAGNQAFNGFYYYNATLSALHKPPDSPADRTVSVHTNLLGYCWFNFTDDNTKDSIDWTTYGWSNKVSIGLPDRSITYASAPATISSSWTMHNAAIITPPLGGAGYVNHPDFVQIFGATVSTNHLFEGNYVAGNTVAAVSQLACQTLAQPQPINDWTFRNNVFVRLRTATSSIKTKWYNNVFYMCGGSGAAISLSTYSPYSTDYRGAAVGSEVKGNIFIAGANGAFNQGWYAYTHSNTNLVNDVRTNCDWNYVVRDTNTWSKVRQTGTTYPPASFDWYEPNGINGGDPGLPFIHLLQFRPGVGSKLIDRGPTLAAVPVDLDGVSRDKGAAPDIGPYEFDPSLKAWWTFDEPGVISDKRLLDWTGGGRTAWNGNPTNWITTEPGPRGNAGVWRQVGVMTNAPPNVYVLSQYAAVTNISGIEFLTNGSISLWVKWARYTNDQSGATRHATLLDSGGTTLQFAYPPSQATNSWKLAYGPPTSTQPAVGPTFYRHSTSANAPSIMAQLVQSRDAATWYHLALTWDADANKVVLFQDGVPLRTNAFGAPFLRIAGRNPLSPPFGASDAIPWLSIGAASHGGSMSWDDDKYPNDGYFVGSMDDIRIYDRPLSTNEVSTLYDANTATLSSGTPDPGGEPTPEPPVITTQSESLTVDPGASVTLSVAAIGTEPFTYQWAKDGAPISETSASMTFTASEATGGVYWCTVYNAYGSDTSESITVTVNPTPPQNLGIIQGTGIIEGTGVF